MNDRFTKTSQSFIIVVIALAMIASLYVTFRQQGIVGWDYTFHVGIAESLLSGDYAGMHTTHGLYPPLFHIFLAGLIKLGVLLPVSLILQLVLYAGIITSITYAVKKMFGTHTAAIAALIIFSSFAVFDRAQVIPQAFDLIFMPLAILFYIQKKNIAFTACIGLIAYIHGVFILPLLVPILIHASRNSEWRKLGLTAFIVCIPMLFLFAVSLPDYINMGSDLNNPQELMATDPIWLISYMGWLPALLIPWGLVTKSKTLQKRMIINGFSGLKGMMIGWLITTVPLLYFMPDRFPAYAMIPAVILGSVAINVLVSRREQYRLSALLILLVIGLLSSYHYILAL